MRSDNSRIIQSGLLLTSLLFLTACVENGTSAPTSTPVATTVSTPAPVITSVGTDFYLTLPDNLCVSDPAKCNSTPVNNKLIVAAATATTGDVIFNGVTTPFSVAAGAETVISLDPGVVLTTNETIETKGIHVTALSPVSVHVVSENMNSADGYLALPTPGLGTKYYVMSYASAGNAGYDGHGSEFAVVATQSATTVTITPSAAGATKQANVAFTVLLNAGETYQLANPANADMTGTLVTADKPIAVISGHRCANVPAGKDYCDYLVEELTDVSIWGKTFHTSLFSGRSRYTVRVIASQNGTTFTTNPTGLISGTLNAGQFADVVMTSAGEFVSNNPVLVAQFMHSFTDDLVGSKGDPSMVMVTPAEMGMTDVIFGVYGLTGTSGTFMNIVTETAALANLKLDNVAVSPALFTPMGGTSIYSVGTIPVAPGAHSLVGTVAFSALVYDYGIPYHWVSYAYPVATMLSLPSAVTTPSSPPISGCVDNDEQHTKDHNQLPNALDHFGKTEHATAHDQGAGNDDDSQECH